jgi:hypothetical protein
MPVNTKQIVILICCLQIVLLPLAISSQSEPGIQTELRLSQVKRFPGTSKNMKINGNHFQDEFIDIDWQPSQMELRATIKNKHKNKIELIWDNASYTDHQQQVSPLYRFKNQKNKLIHWQKREKLKPGDQIELQLIPKVCLNDPQPGQNWQANRAVYCYHYKQSFISEMEKKYPNFSLDAYLAQQTIQLIFHAQINGEIIEYTFWFKSVQVK